jgi:hypothetical protein
VWLTESASASFVEQHKSDSFRRLLDDLLTVTPLLPLRTSVVKAQKDLHLIGDTQMARQVLESFQCHLAYARGRIRDGASLVEPIFSCLKTLASVYEYRP